MPNIHDQRVGFKPQADRYVVFWDIADDASNPFKTTSRERESLFAGWLEVITVYNVFCTDMIMYMDIYVYNPCITPDMKNDGVIPP